MAVGLIAVGGFAWAQPPEVMELESDLQNLTPPVSELGSTPEAKAAVAMTAEQPEIVRNPKPVDLNELVLYLTVFALATFVGFEVIAKVPSILHTPLMSGSNAISGITVVGAMLCGSQIASGAVGSTRVPGLTVLGFLAIVFAMINVVGGFWVTHRMLGMFRRRGE